MRKYFEKKIRLVMGAGAVAGAVAAVAAAPVMADEAITQITDNVTLSVTPTCNFSSVGDASAEGQTFTGSGINGREVSFNNGGVHNFNIACNRTAGYSVLAYATTLVNGSETISFIPSGYTASGGVGKWTAEITDGDSGAVFGTSAADPKPIKRTSTVSNVDGDTFSVTYKAYVGTTTPSGTYTGTAVYVLAMNVDNNAPQATGYSVAYDANGGTGAPAAQNGTAAYVKLSQTVPTRSGYKFLGWAENENAVGPDYVPGSVITVTAATHSHTLYAVWQELVMQEFSAADAAAMANDGTTMTVKDARDGKKYLIAKLNDGNVWMVQNLALEGGTVLTPSLSNVASNWTMPASSTAGFNNVNGEFMENGSHTDADASSYGAYYSFEAATAGTGHTVTTRLATLTYDICPKGWTLPTAEQLKGLAESYNITWADDADWDADEYVYTESVTGGWTAAWRPAFAGGRGDGSLYDAGSYGNWWSRSAYDSNYAYGLDEDTDGGLDVFYGDRYYGFSVRCVRK